MSSLASQLHRAFRALRKAEAKQCRLKWLDESDMNNTRNLLRAARRSVRKARLRLDRVVRDIRSKECLFLYSMEHVQATLRLVEKFGELGRLCGVEIKCRDALVSREMGNVLMQNGFERKKMYGLPPA